MEKFFIEYAVIMRSALPIFPVLTAIPGESNAFSAEAIASLVVAVLTLIATVFIAILVYALQHKDAKRATEKQEIGAKKILFTELSSGLETVIRAPWSGGAGNVSGQLSLLLTAYLPYIQESFEPEQLHHLLQLVDVIASTAKRAADEDSTAAAEYIQGWLSLFVEERFVPAMRSQYSEQFFRIDDYRKILTPLTRSVLEVLSGEPLPPAAGNQLTAIDGTLLLEVNPNGYTKIYDTTGEPLCNALLDTDAVGGYGIEAGWAKTERYVGDFQGGKRYGRGCSYSLWGHHKIFDGKWEDDKPKTGTLFHLVFEKDPCDGKYKDLFPYWDKHTLSHQVTDYLTRRDDLLPVQILAELFITEKVWVENEDLFYDTDTFYPLSDFMEKYDPDGFSRVQELNNIFDYNEENE